MKIIMIIFGLLIGILFVVLMSLGYWKMSSELDSIKELIKIQNNLPTTLQKKEVCAQLFALVKRFKICYVYAKRKPK